MRLYMDPLLSFWRTIRLTAKLVPVHERLTGGPRPVGVREIDALGERRVRIAQDVQDRIRARHVEVLLLEPQERLGGGAVVARDLEPEAVGLVLLVAPERVEGGLRDEHHEREYQREQRPRGDVVEPLEAE